MPKSEDDATEFKVTSLRDLMEAEETGGAKPAAPGGPKRTRQLAIIGGGAAAVVVVLLAVLLIAGGGGKEKAPGDEPPPIRVQFRPNQVSVGVEKGVRVSICSINTGPLAENVRVVEKGTQKDLVEYVLLDVAVRPEDVSRVRLADKDPSRLVTPAKSCPPTPPTAPPPTEPAPAPTDTVPAPAPSEPAPTPPASG